MLGCCKNSSLKNQDNTELKSWLVDKIMACSFSFQSTQLTYSKKGVLAPKNQAGKKACSYVQPNDFAKAHLRMVSI